MTNEELNTALYEKMFSEQETYRAWSCRLRWGFRKTSPSDEHGKSNEDQSRTHNFSAADGVPENG